jgi:Na+-transporting NADH:ubiquinone oxidoreductase subunit NqrB
MDPERLARTTVSVSFAAMAGAILGAVVGFLMLVVLSYWLPAALAVPVLCVAGAIGGLRLGWRWAATMPIEPKADDQEADYSDTPPATPD